MKDPTKKKKIKMSQSTLVKLGEKDLKLAVGGCCGHKFED